MAYRLVSVWVGLCVALVATGCSSGDAGTGISMFMNAKRKDTNLRIYVDGQQAKQSTFRKAATGYAQFKIKDPVTCSPKFRYEIIEPKKFGYIKTVSMQVHQKFEADFSDIADYVIFPKEKGEDAQMKPGVDYDLGAMGPKFKILDRKDNEVSKVEFTPGVEYMLSFTVAGDKSETINIWFKTK